MNCTKLVIGTSALAIALSATPARADKEVPLGERSADDQYQAFDGRNGLFANAALLDQYGDKVGAYARYGAAKACLDSASQESLDQQAVEWAVCGDDMKAIDIEKLKAEMPDFRYPAALERIEKWNKLGVEIEAEAKTDPGIAKILQQTEAAKADWKTFAEKNSDALALYGKLKEGVRSGKSNDKAFDGCWEATQPAFAKVVKATTFSWDNAGDDAVEGRVAEIVTSPTSYLAVANFGMCAFSQHASGGVLAAAALPGTAGRLQLGWRTTLIGKLLAPTFKPKFADRSLTGWESEYGPTRSFRGKAGTDISVSWGGSMKIETGVISKLKKDGDDTAVSFKGTVVDGCVKWIETKKIRTWDTAGDPVYERICKKRGKVEEDAPDDTTMGTKFTDGFAASVGVAVIGSFPVEAYNSKAKKFVAILGVAVKGSPAETPRNP